MKQMPMGMPTKEEYLTFFGEKEEVQKDLSDAGSVGANGTPAFFIGKSTDDGVIEAPLTSGAQPFSVFKTIIDELLK